nr:E-beta-farnesene synthase [Tanacetum cinerariifolium]
MADVNLNVNAHAEQAPAMAPPTRIDDQILPRGRWSEATPTSLEPSLLPRQFHQFIFSNFGTQFDMSETLQDTYGKKKANPIVIPSIRFAKLIIHHLRNKYKFHPRPDSPLHLPYEEYILGYLKFSAKRTKREVFRMPILNELITADIQGEQYYNEYLENVAKHQRYIVSKEGSDPDSLAPKPAKATKKSKPSAPKAAPVTKPAAAKAFESTSSQQPKPKHELAKTQEKKHKLVTKTSNELSPAKRSKPGLVTKRRKPTSSLRLVDEFVDEGIPEREPRFDDEEADMKRVVEESLKSVHDAHRGPLLPMTPKKVSPAEQYIFQRRTPAPTEPSGYAESPSIYAKLEPQPQSSPVFHAGLNLEHMDLETTDVSTQQNPEQMDEGFTATAYPNVQENLKLTVDEQVLLEEPASSTGTLSSLQHLAKDFSFGDQFFNDKPSKAEIEKTTVETEAESMRIGELEQIMANLIQENKHLEERLDSHGSCLYKLENLNIPQLMTKAVDEIVTDAVDWAIQAPLRNCFIDLPEADIKKILHQRMWETHSYKAHKDHMMSPPYQPPPSPPAGPSGTLGSPGASGSSQFPPPYLLSSTSQSNQSKSIQDWWKPLGKDRPATPEPAWSIPSSDLPIPTNNWASALASTYTPPPVNSLLAHTGDMAIFMVWFYKKQGITKLKPQDLEGPAFEIVKVFHPNYQMEECHKLLTDSVDKSIIGYNVSKPLPLGGPPSQVTVQSDFFFNKDLEYLRYGSKGGRLALSISKMKAAYYLDVGLEQMVPDQIWIEKECKYDIAAVYGCHCFEYKHDFTIIDSPRAVTFRDKYGVQMIMRLNEIHKFSDGTLHQIDDALDYRVKEFKKRLKTMRIFRNLESFVGGRVREGDYRLLQRIE